MENNNCEKGLLGEERFDDIKFFGRHSFNAIFSMGIYQMQIMGSLEDCLNINENAICSLLSFSPPKYLSSF